MWLCHFVRASGIAVAQTDSEGVKLIACNLRGPGHESSSSEEDGQHLRVRDTDSFGGVDESKCGWLSELGSLFGYPK